MKTLTLEIVMKSTKYFEQVVNKLGIASLTEMQVKSLEANRIHKDVVLISPTGSGKTLAFLLPALELLKENCNEVQVLIITPSRELAQQIELVFRKLSTKYKVNSCYGGHSIITEKNNFHPTPAVIIGTPGRISDHIRNGNLVTDSIHTLVLDEFDKSLEFGFQQEMMFIINSLTSIKKRILSSATDLAEIPLFTGIRFPFKLNYLLEESCTNNLTINIVKYPSKNKLECLFQLLCNLGSATMLIFCNHRDAVVRISNHLSQSGIINDFFHGGLEQSERDRMLVRFRNGSSNILITTDLASRGLDIPDISFIIHYQIPGTEAAFIHRNGRTARMHSSGSSFLILSDGETLPAYIIPGYKNFVLRSGLDIPQKPVWQTLYIGGGKKEKINKIDIAGFLLKQGGLEKNELGYIEVKDHCSYAAIRCESVQSVLRNIKNKKIKNKKIKIEISY
jgi:ATP-independent RNA helicase DbpA